MKKCKCPQAKTCTHKPRDAGCVEVLLALAKKMAEENVKCYGCGNKAELIVPLCFTCSDQI